MKLSIITLIFSALITGTIIVGCKTSAQKEEISQTNIKDLPKDMHEHALPTFDPDEWKTFKNEYAIKFENNKIRIAELKEQMNKPGKILDPLYAKRIDTLEQKNKDMKTRMDAYGSNKGDWESFKREFDRDMNELGKSLKDFTINNNG